MLYLGSKFMRRPFSNRNVLAVYELWLYGVSLASDDAEKWGGQYGTCWASNDAEKKKKESDDEKNSPDWSRLPCSHGKREER
jgi:hypothetical protein